MSETLLSGGYGLSPYAQWKQEFKTKHPINETYPPYGVWNEWVLIVYRGDRMFSAGGDTEDEALDNLAEQLGFPTYHQWRRQNLKKEQASKK